MDLETILTRAVAEKATDIHLQSGRPPYIRVGAELQPLALPHIQTADLQAWSKETGSAVAGNAVKAGTDRIGHCAYCTLCRLCRKKKIRY